MYEQYTDKQIVEMLVPKLKKAVPELNWDEYLKHPDSYTIWNRLISVIYKSGYIRGQLVGVLLLGRKISRTNRLNIGFLQPKIMLRLVVRLR